MSDTIEVQTEAMPDDTPEPEVKNPAGLIAKSRALLARNAELTARVTELEGQLQTAASEHEKLQASFNDFHIRRPLARLAEEVSSLPDLWIAELGRFYDIKAADDDIGVFTKDGKRCTWPAGYVNAGKPYAFTAADLWHLLAEPAWRARGLKQPAEPQAARFADLMRYFGPSGSGATASAYRGLTSHTPTRDPAPTPAAPAFGLR